MKKQTDKSLDSYSFMGYPESKQKKLLGKKIKTDFFGVGVAVKTDDNRIMVKVIVRCSTKKHQITIYLTDYAVTGDLGNVYNKKGMYQGNVNNSYFKFCNCNTKNSKA